MKKLLLITNAVPHYRVSVYNYLLRRFRDVGWELHVASDGMQPESKLQVRFHFHHLPFSFGNYRRLIGEVRPDLVMFHLHIKDPLFWQLIHWLKLRRTPIVCWTKGANLDRPNSRLRYQLFNYFHGLADAIILYSANQVPLIKERHRGKLFFANNTVNFEDYPPVPESKEEIRREFGIPFEKVVLFAGTMGVDGERKKVSHLISVFRDLKREDVGLILVGSGMTEERLSSLNPSNTRYLGKLHDPANVKISKVFKASDVFVIPGHVGLGLNQAFYWGLPVVTEDGLHPPEIQYLKSGRNGFIVPENDIGQLKEKMLHLLDNESVRSEFGRHAREDIHREASIEAMFSAFHNAVNFALAKRGAPGGKP